MLKCFLIVLVFFFSNCYKAERNPLHFSSIIRGLVESSSFYYSSNYYRLALGSYARIRPIKQGNIISCSISPPLPVGLNLSAQCDVVGVPQVTSSVKGYTVTARFDDSQVKNTYIEIEVVISSTHSHPPNMPYVYFPSSSSTVSESGGFATIPITLSQPSDLPVTVNYSLSGTASFIDYVVNTSNPITFHPGETVKIIHITINDNNYTNYNKTLIFNLYSLTNAHFGGITTHTLTILDDEPPYIGYANSKLLLVKNQPYYQYATITGNITNCTVSPALPSGLYLNFSDCTIQGTPTTIASPKSHTITAYNGALSTTRSIELTVLDDLSYTFAFASTKYRLSTPGQSCLERCASLGGVAPDTASTATVGSDCKTALVGLGVTTVTSPSASCIGLYYPCRYDKNSTPTTGIYSCNHFIDYYYASSSYNLVCPCYL